MKDINDIKDCAVTERGGICQNVDFTDPELLYKELTLNVRKYHPSDDISMIEKAYAVADNAHKGQVRKSGEPYIIHPLNVAIILSELEMDKETICAGLLHDVLEDTEVSETMLRKESLFQEFPTRAMKSLRCRRKTCVRCFMRWHVTFVS